MGDRSDWERFLSQCPDALSYQCRFEHLDQEFCVEAKLSDFGLLPSVPLEAFGDYAFGLTPDRISVPERSWNPREVMGGDGSVELIELAWEGAFEAHGLCTSLDLDAVRFPRAVIYRSEPVVLSASDVTLHGRSGRELFDS
ncbi:MAG: hypothetical protein J0H02_10960 [Armatimonadetes bacterium]|nr:hypothetical protein [Armatimonadota bacterium]